MSLPPRHSSVPDGVRSGGADADRGRRDRELLARYHREGDQRAREELVERFMPLARRLARRYQRGQEPLEDLVQVASMGLVKAVDRFEPSRGTAFSSYAVPTILGELKRYFRDAAWAVHVPRGMQERVMETNTTMTKLSKALGRSPTPTEVALELGRTTEEVLESMEAAVAYDSVSLDAPLSTDGDGGGDAYGDRLGDDDGRFELIELGATIAPTLRALSERDRIVLHLRFAEDLTQSEIAERIGVSQMHVSRLIRRSLARLRTVAEAAENGAVAPRVATDGAAAWNGGGASAAAGDGGRSAPAEAA